MKSRPIEYRPRLPSRQRLADRKALLPCLCALALVLTGCATNMTPLPFDPAAPQAVDVAPGDTVRVYKSDGERFDFRVTAVNARGLYGNGVEIPFEEIRFIEKQATEVDGKRVALLALAVVGALVLIAAAFDSAGGSYYPDMTF